MKQTPPQPSTLCILNWGACSPLGFSAHASAAGAWAQTSRIAAPLKSQVGEAHASYQAQSLLFEAQTPLLERLITLACVALGPMLDALQTHPGRLTVLVGLPKSASRCAHAIATMLQQSLLPRRQGVQQSLSIKVSTSCPGAFADSLDAAERVLKAPGAPELCLVGAVDSLVAPCRRAALGGAGRLYDPQTNEGLIPGEAAAFLCVTSAQKPVERPILAELSNWHKAAAHCAADALRQAIGAALGPQRQATLPCVWVNDDTGEHWRAQAMAELAVSPELPTMDHLESLHPARLSGELGVSFGPLACIVAAHGLRYGLVPQAKALLSVQNGGGDGERPGYEASAWRLMAPQQHMCPLACDGPWHTQIRRQP